MNKKLKKNVIAKVIASITSIIVLLSCMLIGASAAGTVTANTTSFTGEVGDTIVVEVVANDVAGTESGDLRFTYDIEHLEYVAESVGKKDTYDADMCDGGEPEKGLITCGFFFKNALTEKNMRVCSLEFKVLKAGTSSIGVEVASWDGAEAPNVIFNSITVDKVEATTVKLDETTKLPETTIKAPETTEKVVEDVSEEDGSDIADMPAIDSVPQTGESRMAVIIVATVMSLASIVFVTTYFSKGKKND